MGEDPGYGWEVVEFSVEIARRWKWREIHVRPRHEAGHTLDTKCWCAPKVEQHEHLLVVHNEKN